MYGRWNFILHCTDDEIARHGSVWQWLTRTTRLFDVEIITADGQKLHTFSIPHLSSSVEFGITGYFYPGNGWKERLQNYLFLCMSNATLNLNSINPAIQVGRIQVAKTMIYPVMCRFPLFVSLCDHNPPTLQTDRRTDGRTSCS